MAFITSLFAIRLFSVVPTIIFDICCFAYERNSVTNCSQKVLVSNPLPFVHSWIAASNVASIIVLICLYTKPLGIRFCGFKLSYKKLVKMDSFWSLNINFLVILFDNTVRFINESGWVNQVIPVTLAMMQLLHLLVAHFVNFLHPITFSNSPRTFRGVFICVTYWLGIAFYFVENFYLFISFSLDMGENIYPLGNSSSNKDRLFLVILSLVIAAKVAFHIRMVAFFWHKLFHGDKDHFSWASALQKIVEWLINYGNCICRAYLFYLCPCKQCLYITINRLDFGYPP